MTTLHGVVAVVMAVAMATPVAGNYKHYPEWSFQAELGSDFTLVCNDTAVQLQAGDVIDWYDPSSKRIVSSTTNLNKYELVNRNGVQRYSLEVKDIQDKDKGVYLCMVMRNGVFHRRVIRGLNIYQPLMEGVSAYTYNITVAFVAAAIFLALALLGCALVEFNWEKRQGVSANSSFRSGGGTTLGVSSVASDDNANAQQNAYVIDAGFKNPAFQSDKELEALDTRL